MNHIPIVREVTQERLKQLLDYNPNTGVFLWKAPPSNHSRLKGKEAGGKGTGYVQIRIDGPPYKAHQLAWLWVYGVLPPSDVDHKDGNPFNNAIGNLRLCTNPQNQANRRVAKNRDLPKGVRRIRNKFAARISYRGALYHLGVFNTPQAAAFAYYEAAKRYYGEFARMDMGALT